MQGINTQWEKHSVTNCVTVGLLPGTGIHFQGSLSGYNEMDHTVFLLETSGSVFQTARALYKLNN